MEKKNVKTMTHDQNYVDDLVASFNASGEYDPELCRALCVEAGLEEEWDNADSDDFENVLRSAAEALNVTLLGINGDWPERETMTNITREFINKHFYTYGKHSMRNNIYISIGPFNETSRGNTISEKADAVLSNSDYELYFDTKNEAVVVAIGSPDEDNICCTYTDPETLINDLNAFFEADFEECFEEAKNEVAK